MIAAGTHGYVMHAPVAGGGVGTPKAYPGKGGLEWGADKGDTGQNEAVTRV